MPSCSSDDSLSQDAKTEQPLLRPFKESDKERQPDSLSPSLSCPSGRLILVLDQGRIVEEGTASDLLAQEGWYMNNTSTATKTEGE